MASGRGGEQIVIGIENCNVALVRFGRDACAVSATLEGGLLASGDQVGLTVRVSAPGQVILGGYGPAVYELTLEE